MTDIKPFRIDIPQATLDAIRTKVKAYEWHEMPRGAGIENSWGLWRQSRLHEIALRLLGKRLRLAQMGSRTQSLSAV